MAGSGTIGREVRTVRVSILTGDNRIPTTGNNQIGGTAGTPITITTKTIVKPVDEERRLQAVADFWETTVSET